MIARGDLGATIDLVKLPQIQLDIVKKCNLA
jgi:pyruvate kinase